MSQSHRLPPVFLPQEDWNVWREDWNLRRVMRRRLGEAHAWAEPTLDHMGALCGGSVVRRANIVDAEDHTVDHHDRWGQPIGQVRHHPLYLENVRDVYGAGIVGWNHHPPHQQTGQKASMHLILGWGYLTGGADIGLACPICMTHGALWLLERYGSEALKEQFIPGLTSLNPETLQTGGMLLTEITGGSDLGTLRTVATPAPGGPAGLERWTLTGEKWFSSNAGGDVFMVLARPDGAAAGTRGLGLFLMPKYLPDGSHNRFIIRRLKNKIGTRNVPTGEMLLEGAEAYLVGEVNKGIHYMMDMVNLSRLYNAVGSIGLMGRVFLESVRYAEKREAFGKRLEEQPLCQGQLTDLAVEWIASTALTFEAVDAFERLNEGDESVWPLLRIFTPMAKYHTGEWACHFAREAAVVYGGNATAEEFGVARFYRDALILPIWEGTANIQCLDALRAMAKEDSLSHLMALMTQKLDSLTDPDAALLKAALLTAKGQLEKQFAAWSALPKEVLVLNTRRMMDRMIRWVQGVLLLEEACWEKEHLGAWNKFLVALRFWQLHLSGQDILLSGDRFALDWFAAVVKGEPVEAEKVRETMEAALGAVVLGV